MHTVIVLAVGLVLLAACLLLGHALGNPPGVVRVALIFLLLWLLGAALNMFIGVRSAGYGFSEELPVFGMVFAVPALAALAVWWRAH